MCNSDYSLSVCRFLSVTLNMFSMHIFNVTPKIVSVDLEYNFHNYVSLNFVLFVYFYLCYVEF